MIKQNLFSLYSHLSKQEVKELKVFLKSPFFNRSRKLVKTFEVIIRFYPAFSNKKLTNEFIYRKISKNKNYSASTLREMISKLYYLSEKYLYIKSFTCNKLVSGNFALDEFIKRGLDNSFKSALGRIENSIKTKKFDSNILYEYFRLSLHKINYKIINDKIIKKINPARRAGEIINAFNTLTIYFIMETVSFYLNLLFYSSNYNIHPDARNLSEFIKNLNLDNILKKTRNKHPYAFLLDLYIKLLNCFTFPDKEEYYYEYKNALSNCRDLLSKNEISFHYSKIISYCILKIKKNNDNIDFKNELFKNYALSVLNEIYKNETIIYLPLYLYRNIILLGLELNKLKWTEKFIQENHRKVPPSESKNMLNYGLALFYKSAGKLELSLEYSNRVNLNYFIYKYDIKILKLKLYYELGYYEECLYLIHSFKEMLRNDRFLNKERKNKYNTFLKISERLIKNIDNGKIRSNLVNIINKAPLMAQKEWLLEKINEVNNLRLARVS